MEDQRILDLYFARDEQAITQSDAKYGGYCRTIAMNILKNMEDSEECVSDTWLHAWNAIPPQRPSVLSAFFGRITRNLSFDRYRMAVSQKRGGGQMALALDELGECVAADSSPEASLSQKELSAAIDRFLRTLPEQQCDLFLRRYWYVDSIQDISRRFGLKENTVKSQLKRIRDRLKEVLQEEGYPV